MKKYLFKFNSTLEEGYLEDAITEVCTDPFYTQLEGIEIISEMVEENTISISNALFLIHEIVGSDMMLWIEEGEENRLDSLTYYFIMSTYMMGMREKIQIQGLSKKIEEKRTELHICKHCGCHGYLLFDGKVSEEIICKSQASEVVLAVFSKNEISDLQKKDLLKEIEESSLPDIDRGRISGLN